MTGVEAISDGVPAFKTPEWINARTTLTAMVAILAVTFAGITFLAHQYRRRARCEADRRLRDGRLADRARRSSAAQRRPTTTSSSRRWPILVLAANTAYSDFPRLAYFLARDRFCRASSPSAATAWPTRPASSRSACSPASCSSIFGGEIEHLIPLYASASSPRSRSRQFGMVMRWRRRREPGWQRGPDHQLRRRDRRPASSRWSWRSPSSRTAPGCRGRDRPLLIADVPRIHRHYTSADSTSWRPQTPLDPEDIHHTVIVPISSVNRVALQTLAYARSISDNVTAVHITDDEARSSGCASSGTELGIDVPLVIIESPYRALVGAAAQVHRRDRQAARRTTR